MADPDDKTAGVIVPDYQLSLAIGKEGQNARLAARLTGYKIDIKSETQAIESGDLPENYLELSEGVYEEEYEEAYEEGYEEAYPEDGEETGYDEAYPEDVEDAGYGEAYPEDGFKGGAQEYLQDGDEDGGQDADGAEEFAQDGYEEEDEDEIIFQEVED